VVSCSAHDSYSFAFRKGELLNLRVRQVDLASRQIRLDAGTTKNDEARIAPMTDEVATLLTASVIGKQKNDHVFTRPAAKTGLPAEPVRGFRRRWAKVCCAVGLGELVCPDCYRNWKNRRLTQRVDVMLAAKSGGVRDSSMWACSSTICAEAVYGT
jgi:integrase